MNSALKNHATYINNKVDTNEISISQYISTDNILQNKQGIECATSLPIQGGKVTAFKKGDILLANIRPYLKKIWYAQFDGGCSADVLAIRANAETDSHFLFYALFRDDFFIHAMKGAKGTKMPRGDKAQIMEFKIPVFDLKTQQSIAAVLSTLDKKIALNKQINARLEEMAKTLYDYWFVQFDFPDANGKPYKSSGGEMVFDETLKREIPKGWEVKSLGEVITHSTTGLNPRDNFSLGNGENFYVTIKNIKDNEIKFHTCAKITDEALNVINKRSKLDKGDILFTSIEPIGSTYLLHEKPKNWDINESVFSIRSKSDFITPYFLFMLLSSDEIKSFTRQVSTGSVHKGIRHESLKRFTFAYSGIDLIKNFTNLISPMQQNIFFLQKQNHHLTQLRDFLLPMLMNGQVSVAE